MSYNDYKKITQYYQIPKTNNKTYKELAENILADKLCKCIKKVRSSKKHNEALAISVCRNSIFKKRNIDFYTFKCKKGQNLLPKKGTKKNIKKFRKNINFNKTKKSKINK